MTLNELSQVYYLKNELTLYKKRRAELRDKIEEDQKLMLLIEEKERELTDSIIRIENFISTIDDSLTRQIFVLRFIKNYSWLRVAREVGGNNTDENVKRICYRYLQKK